MEKIVKIEDIEYVVQTRKVKQTKALRNRLGITGFKPESEVALGDFQVLMVFSSLKSWSRPEPLTQENFESLTPEPHIDELFNVQQEVNSLIRDEKN